MDATAEARAEEEGGSPVELPASIANAARRTQRSLERDGIVETLKRGFVVVGRDAEALWPPTRRARRVYLEQERRFFDEHYGVTTAVLAFEPSAMDVRGPRGDHGVRYQPVDVTFDLRAALEGLGLKLDETIFIDVGAGTGRALMMAAELPFLRVIGIEYSEALAARAEANIRGCTLGDERRAAIEVVHADAIEYPLPDSKLVLFLYNPFDCQVMGEFVGRVRGSVRDDYAPDRRHLRQSRLSVALG